jgi:hypothetical protein
VQEKTELQEKPEQLVLLVPQVIQGPLAKQVVQEKLEALVRQVERVGPDLPARLDQQVLLVHLVKQELQEV